MRDDKYHMDEALGPSIDELDDDFGYSEGGSFWGGEPIAPESADPFEQFGPELDNEDNLTDRFSHNSVEDVASKAGVDTDGWNKIAESTGGDVLQREDKGGRDWLYKDQNGEKASVTGSQAVGERHQQILDSLYSVGYSISEYQKPDSDVQVKEVYFADEKGHISYQIFEKQIERDPNALMDGGDGLDVAETAVADSLQENAVESAEAELQETLAVATELGAVEGSGESEKNDIVVRETSSEPHPDPLRTSEREGGEKAGGIAEEFTPSFTKEGEGGVLDSEFDDLELSFPETDRAAAERQRAIAESLENLNISPDTVVRAETAEEHSVVDEKGYEVPPSEIKEQLEEKTPDVFELTQTAEIREKLEPYLKEMTRHLEPSISMEAPAFFYSIENPTVADIKIAEKLRAEDMRNEQLFGGRTEAEFNKKQQEIKRRAEEKKEQSLLAQDQERRAQRRMDEEEDEEEEMLRAEKSYMEAAAGAAEPAVEDRQNDQDRGVENNVVVFAQGEERRTAVARQSEQQEQIRVIERQTGIRLVVENREARRAVEKGETAKQTETREIQNSIKFVEEGVNSVPAELAKAIGEIASDTGIRLVMEKPAETAEVRGLAAERLAEILRANPGVANVSAADDSFAGNPRILTGNSALELAA